MNKTTQKKKNSRREFLIALLLLLVLLAAVATVVLLRQCEVSAPDDARQAPELPYDVPGFTMLEDIDGARFDNGLSVLCAGKYSGMYYEDGTDEQVTDVLSVIIRNDGSSLVEYGVIELPVGKQTASFSFSGLPAGAAVLVQAQDRFVWSDGMKHKSFTCTDFALPTSVILDFGADFEIYPADGVLNVKNITNADISGDVSVFYKNFDNNLFMGGITYRARFTGGISAGQYAQSMQSHYYLDTSAILYMAYDK